MMGRTRAAPLGLLLPLLLLALLATEKAAAAPAAAVVDAPAGAASAAAAPPPPRPVGAPPPDAAPWTWSYRNWLGMVACALNAATGAATGQGGSQILVPIGVLAAQMSMQEAAAFSAAVSAFGALPNLLDALTAPHPLQPGARPIVDFPALALGMPALLVGVKMGTLFNKSAPAYILTLLLVLLYGWGAIDLSISYARLLTRERERDALLKTVKRRLDRSATLERALSGGAGEVEGDEAALWAEGVEEEEGEGGAARLPPAAALSRKAQAPLLVPAGKALLAERLALQRDLARLQELSAEILRREARGVHTGALHHTLDADLLAAFRAEERARHPQKQQPQTQQEQPRARRWGGGAGRLPSHAEALEGVEGGSPTAAAPQAARARGASFWPSEGGPGGGGGGGGGNLRPSPASRAPGAAAAAGPRRPPALDALARQLLATAHEHERGARMRRVRASALTDERYRRHAAAAAAADASGSASAGDRSEHRLASLRSAVSVTAAAALGRAGASNASSFSSSFSSFRKGLSGSSPPGSARWLGGGGGGGGGRGGSGSGGGSGVGGASPPLSPQGSMLATAGSRPLGPDVGVQRPRPPPLARSASDLLAVSPWAAKHGAAAAKEDGDGDDAQEADVEGGCVAPAAARAKATDRDADYDGTEGWLAEEEQGGATRPPGPSRLSAFLARRADAFRLWWRLLPKFEASVVIFAFSAFLAWTLGPEFAFGQACSLAGILTRVSFALLMAALTAVAVVVVCRRQRAEAAAAAAASAADARAADARVVKADKLAAAAADAAPPSSTNGASAFADASAKSADATSNGADANAAADAAAAADATSPLPLARGRHEAAVSFSPLLAAATAPCALAVGALGASVGASGSVIVQPVALRMGVHPQVVSATSKILLFVSTAASSLSLALAGRMNAPYALGYGLITLAFTPLGQMAADRLVKKRGRPSLIVAVNIARYALGVALLVGVALVPGLQALARGEDGARFVSPC